MAGGNTRFADARFKFTTPGLGSVGQYQTSGIPYISSSITVPVSGAGGAGVVEITFEGVTKFVTVVNEATGTSKPLRVGFSSLGVQGSDREGELLANNYFVLNNGESYTGEWRVAKLYLTPHVTNKNDGGIISTITTASVIAGQTGIPTSSLINLADLPLANWSASLGVGGRLA
jgi:hypothetical protein|tara:strand:- start:675 stop:1196 length:522 start_codon:yes stop_codon:yes gene_type:complete